MSIICLLNEIKSINRLQVQLHAVPTNVASLNSIVDGTVSTSKSALAQVKV